MSERSAEIVFHLGAHCTEATRLMAALSDACAAHDHLAVPRPEVYARILRRLAARRDGAPGGADEAHAVLALAVPEGARRSVLLNQGIVLPHERAVADHALYPGIDAVARVAALFPDADLTISMCLRDPATLLPVMHARMNPRRPFAAFLGGNDPEALRWARTVADLRAACPGARVVLWRYEDQPWLWETILRAMGDLRGTAPLEGALDPLREAMSADGAARLDAYLSQKDPGDAGLRARVLAAFAARFPAERAPEHPPAFTDAVRARISRAYGDDLEEIAAMEGVTLLGRR